MKTINELINEQLERSYRKIAIPFLRQIQAITNEPQSDMQESLGTLDEEADRLEQEGEGFTPDNEQLIETLEQYAEITDECDFAVTHITPVKHQFHTEGVDRSYPSMWLCTRWCLLNLSTPHVLYIDPDLQVFHYHLCNTFRFCHQE